MALRILAQGEPGTGKTGALASLLNTGRFRVGLVDFESNTLPLQSYVKPEFHKNVLIVPCRDKLVMMDANEPIKQKGTPKAFRTAWRAVDEFTGIGLDGKERSWGPATSWGSESIFAVDGISGMGEAGMLRILDMMGRTTVNRRKQEWGVVQTEIRQYFDNLVSALSCHIYAIAHLKIVSPRLIEPEDNKGNNAGITEEVAQAVNEQFVELIPNVMRPTIPGQNLSRNFPGMFPMSLLFDTDTVNDVTKLVIRTTPQPTVVVKVPVAGLPSKLPIDTGLLTIFNALHENGGLLNGKGKK